MNKTSQLLADLDYLEQSGLTVEQLRTLHHWSGRPEAEARVTFASARDYVAQGRDMKTNNTAFADRLRFVAQQHQLQHQLAALVEQALFRFPL